MNWNKLLYKAWKDYYSKQKGKYLSAYIKSFVDDYKTKIQCVEQSLQQRQYKFNTWKAILIPKNDEGFRPIIKPISISDKLVLKAISIYLSMILEPVFDRVSSISYAYQKGKSTRDALIQLRKIHNPKNILLKIDIKHFFDEIDKTILINLLNEYSLDEYIQKLIFESLNPIVDYSGIKECDIDKFPKGGIPQGNSISNVLSNLYLYELDKLALSNKWKMVRYADDMVLSVSNIDEAKLVLSQIERYLLDNRKLTIHQLGDLSKSKTYIFLNLRKEPMLYLGVMFNGEKLYPAPICYDTLKNRIKTVLSSTSTVKEKEISIQNAISQWCGYYAFTDIPQNKLKRLNTTINYLINKCELNISNVNIGRVLEQTRKHQNNKLAKMFAPKPIGKEFWWLNIYS